MNNLKMIPPRCFKPGLTLLGLACLVGLLLSSSARLTPPASLTDMRAGKSKEGRSSRSAAMTASLAAASDASIKAQVSQLYHQLPLSFEANRGQSDEQVRFISHGQGYSLFLTSTEAILSLSRAYASATFKNDLAARRTQTSRAAKQRQTVLRMKLAQANPAPQIEGFEELRGKSNYLIGDDPKQWRTDIPHYAKVRYREVYPGVDLVYYGHQRQLEYDFVVAPGTDPDIIKLAFAGAQQMQVEANGDLVIRTAGGEVRQRKPVIYQEANGIRKEIAGHYVIKGKSEVGFEIGAYDTSQSLVIDPVLSYSTYLGGTGGEEAYGIAVDNSGNAYLTGVTSSTDFPLKPPGSGRSGTSGFVAKIDTTQSGANSLVYSTYITNIGRGIAVDSAGRAYVATGGATGGVLKLNAAGTSILYSFGVGGSSRAIAVDGFEQAYITGEASNSGLTLRNEFQSHPGGNTSAFVAKLDTTKSGLASVIYSTYLGSGGTDIGYGIAVDNSGHAYITGGSNNAGFPLKNQLHDFQGGSPTLPTPTDHTREAFVARIDTTKSGADSLIYSTYLGGNSNDTGRGIVVDNTGNAYVTGFTKLGNFPAKNSVQTFKGSLDVFVTKIDTNKSGTDSLVYSTYLGGFNNDRGHAIAVSASGSAYVAGTTSSLDFPLSSPYQGQLQGPQNSFVARLSAAGNSLLFSTYLGGATGANGAQAFTSGYNIAVDSSNNVYIVGGTNSNGHPLLNQAQGFQGDNDIFLTKFSSVADLALTKRHTGNFLVGSNSSYTLTVTNVGNQTVTGTTQVTDTLPNGISFVSASGAGWTCSAAGQTVTCTRTTPIAEEESTSITLNVVASASAVPRVTNTATVANPDDVTATSNNTASDPTDVVCAYGISPASQQFGSGGGSGSLTVTASGDCGWIALSSVNWILITSGSSGIGNGMVTYSVLGNPGQAQRSGTITIGDQTFTITQAGQVYAISGRVTLLGSGLSGVTVSLSGAQSSNQQTDSNGNYSFTNLPATGNFTVTPSRAGHNFTPASRSVTNLTSNQTLDFVATVTIANVSGASYESVAMARESIVSAFGTDLATATQAATSLPLPTSLAGTQVSIRDSGGQTGLASLFFVSPGQINYQLPAWVRTGTATVTVTNGAGINSVGTVLVGASAPGLFAANSNGQGVVAGIAVRLRADLQTFEPVAQFDAQQNKFVPRPLDLGPETDLVFLELFGTGFRNRSSLSAVSVQIGGVTAEVQYAGAQGDFAGLDQLNVRLPRSLIGRGEVPVVLTVDGQMANTVSIIK